VVVYLPLFFWLTLDAPAGGLRLAVMVYAIGVLTMLSVSAVYHSGRISPRTERRLKRVDHSTILLAIAGSNTAVSAFALHDATRIAFIAAVWIAAAIGVGVRMLWIDAPPPVVAVVYVIVGWLPAANLGAYLDGLTDGEFTLIVLGGVLYTVGAVVYALKKPNPWPRTFGYHEVFHAFVIAGVTSHYLAVLSL